MSMYDRIKKLTWDPGVLELAAAFDTMQAQVNSCCGDGVQKAKAVKQQPPGDVPTDSANK